MELFDEELDQNKKTENKRTTTIILVVIIFLILMITALIAGIIYIKEETLSVKLNGVADSGLRSMVKVDDNDPTKVYIPIKKVASKLGYSAYDGNYEPKSQDDNMCYVESDNEVAIFSLNSDTIYKVLKDTTQQKENTNYESYTIDEKVKSIDGELCTTIDGIEKAFNVSWSYDADQKKMDVYTLPFLVNSYGAFVKDAGYTNISEDFTNQKSILNNMIVVEKGEDDNNKIVGVISTQRDQNQKVQTILEAKYQSIKYLPRTGDDFMVSDNNKMGIISAENKKTVIPIQYDDIQLMDFDAKLYAVKDSSKYGVIDFSGNKVINIEYDQIGIDNTQFKENGIRNGYVLANTLIPVEQGDKWGFFDTKGKQVTECKYTTVGYTASSNNTTNLLLVPDYNVIVVGNNDKYTVMTLQGKEVWDFFPFDSIYLYISGGTTSYKMVYNSQVLDLTTYLDSMGYGKNGSNSNNAQTQNNTQANNQNNTASQEQQNNDQNNQNGDNQNNEQNEEQNNEQNNDQNGDQNQGEQQENNGEQSQEGQN